MGHYAAKRTNDNMIAYPQTSPKPPSDLIQLAVNKYGGVAGDWEVVTLDDSQMAAVLDNLPQQAYFDGDVTQKTFTLSKDQETVQALISGEPQAANQIVVSVDTGDAAAGVTVRWEVTAPSGEVTRVDDVTIAGIDSWTMVPVEIGTYQVLVEVFGYGVQATTFESE